MLKLIALAAALAAPVPNPLPPQAGQTIKFDKYQVELRVPEGGLFAGEEIDVEFRVVDSTQKDPVEDGFKGVGAIEATARLTMPEMPGMPPAIPEVHREGVPGDYGIVLFFPHGGTYKIDLELKIPQQGVHHIAFTVNVADERPEGAGAAPPYRLDVVEWPNPAKSGQPLMLKMRVIDTKTGAVQTAFDVAHEMNFHLLVVSKDLNWFRHEHPVMSKDGTWELAMTFPAGGSYGVFGDVAPAGKGSRILGTNVVVQGPKPTWETKLVPGRTAMDDGLKGLFAPVGSIEVGRQAVLQVKLFDVKNGLAVGDTEPWLGAAGHMMIFHQDGKTVVHSHPAESEQSMQMVKKGIIRFSARFPKPGLYKVYAQVSWRGKIHTLGFAINISENS